MKIQRISDNIITAFLSDTEVCDLGCKDEAELRAAVLHIIACAAGAEPGFRFSEDDCEITKEDGYLITVKAKKRRQNKKTAKTVLCFDNGAALHSACVYLCDKNIRESSLLCEGRGADKTYYLIIEYGAEPDPLWLSSVSELCFAVHTDKKAFLYYIYEHCGTILEKNAVFDIANSEKTW